jgi:hypothetical protein
MLFLLFRSWFAGKKRWGGGGYIDPKMRIPSVHAWDCLRHGNEMRGPCRECVRWGWYDSWGPEMPGRKDRVGVGILTPKCGYRAYMLGIAWGVETKGGAYAGSVWGKVHMVVEVLGCWEKKIAQGVGFGLHNRKSSPTDSVLVGY